MKPIKLTLSAVVALSSIVACSSDDSSTPEKKDVQLACNEMCTASGFTSARKDEQPHEVNCFCSVTTNAATANVDLATCQKMCTSIGKSGGKPFGTTSTGKQDSCQCE